jgi:two-component system, cell cycle sensor histidine kinase and response regulator CckA
MAAPTATILVCEDDDQLRTVVEIMLDGQGYRVLLAARPQQALELAAEHCDAIDLLVTDLSLPQMSGTELADRLRACVPNLEVLVLSGHPPDGLRGPHQAYLQKPFTDTSLLQTIRLLLEPHHH